MAGSATATSNAKAPSAAFVQCRPVRITSASLVTPLGRSAIETAAALLRSETTARRVRRLSAGLAPDFRIDPTELARATASVPLQRLDAPDRAIALASAAIDGLHAPVAGAAMFLGASKGAIASLVALAQGDRTRPEAQRAAVLGPHGWLAAALRERFALGDATSVVAACASGLVALDRAARAISVGAIDRALVVSVEASLCPLFVEAYSAMGALASVTPIKAHVAKPLDAQRTGFTLCECAAALLLERDGKGDDAGCAGSAGSLTRSSALALTGTLLGTAVATEPFDIVRSAPAFGAIERVARSLLASRQDQQPAPLALLQPHATGTIDNDERELSALARALGPAAIETPVYANKGALGHGMGASGLVSVALSLALAKLHARPPMPWLDEPIDTPFPLSREGGSLKAGDHMALAAGFGGHVAAALYRPA